MKCKYNAQDIESFLESIFVSNEKKAFMEHLDTCPKCKNCYMILNELGDMMNTPVRLGKDMSAGVMKAIDRSKYKKGRGMLAFKGLFFKYPSVIKSITSMTAALFLIMVIGANFADISYSLGNFKENVIDKLNISRKLDKDKKALITNNDKKNVNTQIEGTRPLNETVDKEKANQIIDPDTMLTKLKNDILSWNNIRLVALDYPEYTLNLTKEQKTALASKLTEISDIGKFDGGITPSREAAYPFYILEFLDDSGQIKYPESVQQDGRGIYDDSSYCGYSFVVAGEDRLLVTLGDRLEYYGLNQYSVPIKFIKVNKEFISFIKKLTLMTVPPNTDKDSLNYLLNAVKVNFMSQEKNDFNGEFALPQQVWKTVRRIMEYTDFTSPTAVAQSQGESKLYYEVSFTFTDGSIRKVEITDDFIRYNGYCYKYNSLFEKRGMKPENIIRSLYTGYF